MQLIISLPIIFSTSLALVACNPPLTRNVEAAINKFIPPEEVLSLAPETENVQDLPGWIRFYVAAQKYYWNTFKELWRGNIEGRTENNTDDLDQDEPFENDSSISVDVSDGVLANWRNPQQNYQQISNRQLRNQRRMLRNQRRVFKQQRALRKQFKQLNQIRSQRNQFKFQRNQFRG